MNEIEFAALSSRQQVNKLRAVALEALRAYPLEVKRLSLLSHGFNTIFRVDDTRGQKFALRLNVNSRRTPENVRAELAWLDALNRETDLRVPVVVPTRDGNLLQSLEHENAPRILLCALFEWIPGPNIGENLTDTLIEELGALTAKLHIHALSFKLPAGCELPSAQNVLYDMPHFLFETVHEHLPDSRLELFQRALEVTQKVSDTAWARQAPRVIHTDLHQWNLKRYRKQIYVFDFDDAGIGQPVQDVAISLYYLRGEKNDEGFRAALERGYSRIASWPAASEYELEAFMAARGLLLANDVVSTLNPEFQAIIPGFLEKTENRMRNFLENGVYAQSSSVPGSLTG
jgi:Ser/Thr protein kinase RdoA (MazF antagonist)